MELRELETFVSAAKLGSFSKAALHLGYSQANVTIQIKHLEQELGVHLFDRMGKQTTLTHQGLVFYEYAAGVLRDLEQARDALQRPGSSLPCGHLRIGAIESICSSILPGLLSEYHRRYPGVSVSIVTDSPHVLLEQMNRNKLDLVYLLDMKIYDSKWVKLLEEPEEVQFVCTASHPLCGKTKVSLDELLAQDFILTEHNASYRYILDQYLAAEGKSIRPYLESGNTEFLIRFLEENRSVSFLPHFCISDRLLRGSLGIFQVDRFHLRVWRQLFYHKDKWVSREMSAFFELALGKEMPAK